MSKAVAEVITNTQLGGVINEAYPVGTKLYLNDHAEELVRLLHNASTHLCAIIDGKNITHSQSYELLLRINIALNKYSEATGQN